jgi:uncharacterized membrane protein
MPKVLSSLAVVSRKEALPYIAPFLSYFRLANQMFFFDQSKPDRKSPVVVDMTQNTLFQVSLFLVGHDILSDRLFTLTCMLSRVLAKTSPAKC